MKRVLPLVWLVSCGFDLDVPSAVKVACTRDADCPDGRVCAPLLSECVSSLDTEPPRLLGVDVRAPDQLQVVFSEPVSCLAAGNVATYAIEPTLAVHLAAGADCDESKAFTSGAVLFTEVQTPTTTYTLTATALTDSGGNPLAADASAVSFAGFGQAPDPSPPDALAPPDGTRVLGARQPLVWTTRPGATRYLIEVETDDGPIAGSPFTISAPATTLQLEGLTDVTYYWRVRSDLTPEDEIPATHDFDVVIDTVYVACAGSGACDETVVRNGSRTHPYASVQRALAAAAELSTSLDVQTPTIKIAAREAGAPYPGAVVVQWQSVRLIGGFDATFTTRSTDAAATVLESDGAVMYVINLPLAVSALVEGLTLRSTRAETTPLVVNAASSSLTVRNVAIEGPGSLGGLVAVRGGPAPGPLFEGCKLRALPSEGTVTMVTVASAAPTFRDSVFEVAADAYSYFNGMQVDGPLPGDAVFDRFDLLAPASTSISYGMSVDFAAPGPGRVVIRNATLHTGTGITSSGSVIYMKGYASVVVERSHLAAGLATAGVNTSVIDSDTAPTNRIEIFVRDSVLEGAPCPLAGCLGNVVLGYNVGHFEVVSSLVLARGSGAAPLAVDRANPLVANSVFAGFDPSVPCIGRRPGFSGWTTPIALLNTALVHCNGLEGREIDGDPILATTGGELSALNGQPIESEVCAGTCADLSRVQSVVPFAAHPTSVFTDLDGNDNDANTIDDNDYTVLPSADAFIRQGGLADTADICAPIGQNNSCGITASDFYGDARDTPYSIGHDEVP